MVSSISSANIVTFYKERQEKTTCYLSLLIWVSSLAAVLESITNSPAARGCIKTEWLVYHYATWLKTAQGQATDQSRRVSYRTVVGSVTFRNILNAKEIFFPQFFFVTTNICYKKRESFTIFRGSWEKCVVFCPWRFLCQINSRKDSLVYLTKGQTAYGLCHLVHLLTTLSGIQKARTFLPELRAKQASRSWNRERKRFFFVTHAENS